MKAEERVLNALRMGVIPGVGHAEFMVGNEHEEKEMENFLSLIAEGGSQVRYIRGPYGSGKSFLLKHVSETALSQNFIVASIPIHSGFGFSKFEDIYSNIMANLSSRFNKGSGTSFESIFDHWLAELKRQGDMQYATKNIYRVITELNAYNSSYANVLLAYIRAKINNNFDLANVAAAWIKGDRNMTWQLKKQLNVKGSIDRENAMSIFKGFVKLVHSMGYKGIVVTFDEAEIMMQQRSDIRLKAYGNIRQLMDYAGSGDLDHCGFIFAGTPEFYEDKEKGVPSYQALAQRIGEGIKGSGELKGTHQSVIELSAFNKADFVELCQKVYEIHSKTVEASLGLEYESLANMVMLECQSKMNQEITVRIFLKKLIEMLDLFVEHPEMPLIKALQRR